MSGLLVHTTPDRRLRRIRISISDSVGLDYGIIVIAVKNTRYIEGITNELKNMGIDEKIFFIPELVYKKRIGII